MFESESDVDTVLVGGLTKSASMFMPLLQKYLTELGVDKSVKCRIFEGDVVVGALYKAGMTNKKFN